MTGQEKIRATILMIDKFHKELISGNEVLLENSDFENIGIQLEDHLDILNALKNSYKIIDYSYTKPYRSDDYMQPDERNAIIEYAHRIDVHEGYLIGKRLSSRNYTIKVLPAFNDIRNKAEANILPSSRDYQRIRSGTEIDSDYNNPSLKAMVIVYFRRGQIEVGFRVGDNTAPLGPPLQYGRALYNFMNYIDRHPFQTINIHDIREQVEGCKNKNDLTELVRNCHFDKELKKIFFERTTRTSVRFIPWRELGGSELRDFEEKLVKLRKDNAKYRKIPRL